MGSPTMSYGGAASAATILGASFATMYGARIWHNSVIQAESQPVTMSAEFKAAEIKRMLAKPSQSNENKVYMQNPRFAYTFDHETGQAKKFGVKEGDAFIVSRTVDEE